MDVLFGPAPDQLVTESTPFSSRSNFLPGPGARHISIGAKNAAMAGERLEAHAAASTIVKEHTAFVGISSSSSCPHSGQVSREIRIGLAIQDRSSQQSGANNTDDGGQDTIGRRCAGRVGRARAGLPKLPHQS